MSKPQFSNPACIGTYADKKLTNAQTLAIYTTPIELVKAPQSGHAVIVDGVFVYYDFVTAAIQSTHDMTIRYTNGSGATIMTIAASGLLDAAADVIAYCYPTTTAYIIPVAAAAVIVAMGSGNMTTGAGYLKFRTFYHVVPTT